MSITAKETYQEPIFYGVGQPMGVHKKKMRRKVTGKKFWLRMEELWFSDTSWVNRWAMPGLLALCGGYVLGMVLKVIAFVLVSWR